MVPAPARPVLATPARAFVPDASPSLASSDRRLIFIGLNNVFFGIGFLLYGCLDRVTADFFFAYSVLAKPECAFVPDVRLVLAKLWPHLVLDGSDCIGSGIDILYVCLDASPSLSSRTMRMRLHMRLPRHRHPTTTTTTALSSRGYPDQGYTTPTLSATSTRHKGLSPRRAPRQLSLRSKPLRRDTVHDTPARTAGGCQPTGCYFGFSPV